MKRHEGCSILPFFLSHVKTLFVIVGMAPRAEGSIYVENMIDTAAEAKKCQNGTRC
jgi:hypothetical protein